VEEFWLGPNRVRVLARRTGYGFAEGTFVPGPGPASHRHSWDEGFYVLSGSLRVTIDDHESILRPGDFGLAVGGSFHTFEATEPSVFFATFSDVSALDYLEQMGALLAGDAPAHEGLKELHRSFGVATA